MSAEWKPGFEPKVITLCGSTKFKQEYIEANFRLTISGYVVFSVGWFSHADGVTYQPTDDEKILLDFIHLAKIDKSDSIFVINVNGYVGRSTKNEIAYAMLQGKTVRWLEPSKALSPDQIPPFLSPRSLMEAEREEQRRTHEALHHVADYGEFAKMPPEL
jgi:hypothetical protein